MEDIVYYRLPEADKYYVLRGATRELGSMSELNGVSGFVMAPFERDREHPLMLFMSSGIDQFPVPTDFHHEAVQWREIYNRADYRYSFSQMHRLLADGVLDKVVLAKRSDCKVNFWKGEVEDLFFNACQLYPHQMVVLVKSRRIGVWLMATPEVLLERKDSRWHTMALAGTQTEDVPWNLKNQREQRIVSEYVQNTLKPYVDDMQTVGPRTAKAGNLYHLCTDFSFTIKPNVKDSQLIESLHPTPAVCGLPKEAALSAIKSFETISRGYYSGFCGPWNIHDESHLYVSLRCMQMYDARNFSLYAGGGLLKESRDKEEWEETEAKMNVMRRLLE